MQCNAPGIRFRRYDKIVFQLPLIAVIEKVNAWIDLTIPDLSECWQIGMPVLRIAADKVAGFSWQLIDAFALCIRVRADEVHLQVRLIEGGICGLQGQDSLRRGQEDRIARTTGEELDLGVRLTLIFFELHRQTKDLGVRNPRVRGPDWMDGASGISERSSPQGEQHGNNRYES